MYMRHKLMYSISDVLGPGVFIRMIMRSILEYAYIYI